MPARTDLSITLYARTLPDLISTASEPARGPKQHFMERAMGLSPTIKRLERKADSRTRIRTEVKNAWNVVNTSRVVTALLLSNATKNDVYLQYSNKSVRN